MEEDFVEDRSRGSIFSRSLLVGCGWTPWREEDFPSSRPPLLFSWLSSCCGFELRCEALPSGVWASFAVDALVAIKKDLCERSILF